MARRIIAAVVFFALFGCAPSNEWLAFKDVPEREVAAAFVLDSIIHESGIARLPIEEDQPVCFGLYRIVPFAPLRAGRGFINLPEPATARLSTKYPSLVPASQCRLVNGVRSVNGRAAYVAYCENPQLNEEPPYPMVCGIELGGQTVLKARYSVEPTDGSFAFEREFIDSRRVMGARTYNWRSRFHDKYKVLKTETIPASSWAQWRSYSTVSPPPEIVRHDLIATSLPRDFLYKVTAAGLSEFYETGDKAHPICVGYSGVKTFQASPPSTQDFSVAFTLHAGPLFEKTHPFSACLGGGHDSRLRATGQPATRITCGIDQVYELDRFEVSCCRLDPQPAAVGLHGVCRRYEILATGPEALIIQSENYGYRVSH